MEKTQESTLKFPPLMSLQELHALSYAGWILETLKLNSTIPTKPQFDHGWSTAVANALLAGKYDTVPDVFHNLMRQVRYHGNLRRFELKLT